MPTSSSTLIRSVVAGASAVHGSLLAVLAGSLVYPAVLSAEPTILVSEHGSVTRVRLSSDEKNLVSLVGVPNYRRRSCITIWDLSEKKPLQVLFSPHGSPGPFAPKAGKGLRALRAPTGAARP